MTRPMHPSPDAVRAGTPGTTPYTDDELLALMRQARVAERQSLAAGLGLLFDDELAVLTSMGQHIAADYLRATFAPILAEIALGRALEVAIATRGVATPAAEAQVIRRTQAHRAPPGLEYATQLGEEPQPVGPVDDDEADARTLEASMRVRPQRVLPVDDDR